MLQTKVETATLRDDDTWELSYCSTKSSATGEMFAKRLVIAAGLTSEPYMPIFKGQDDFQGLRIHSKELKPRADELAKCQNVVVIGGNKSAWDVCYSVARRGGKVHMVMRPSGGGPSWVWPRRFKWFGWQTSLPKLTMTRIFSLFDPWPFVEKGTIWSSVRSLLHHSKLGLALTNTFWKLLGRHVCKINRYRESSDTEKLEPWCSTYWMGNSLSTLNYPTDWFDFVRSGIVEVHHAEVDSMSRDSIQLTDGFLEDVDALVSCTGWDALPAIDFQPPEIRLLLGLPQAQQRSDELLVNTARQWILNERPYLAAPSRIRNTTSAPEKALNYKTTPYRLYRFVVPNSERLLRAKNLAFIGINFSLHTVILAQAQALWITAFFKDRLPQLQDSNIDQERIIHDTVLHSEYQALRRPRAMGGAGEKFPDLVFDSIPYVDLLLGDLGLETRRKGGGLRDWLVPYTVGDYRGLVQEWQQVAPAE